MQKREDDIFLVYTDRRHRKLDRWQIWLISRMHHIFASLPPHPPTLSSIWRRGVGLQSPSPLGLLSTHKSTAQAFMRFDPP